MHLIGERITSTQTSVACDRACSPKTGGLRFLPAGTTLSANCFRASMSSSRVKPLQGRRIEAVLANGIFRGNSRGKASRLIHWLNAFMSPSFFNEG